MDENITRGERLIIQARVYGCTFFLLANFITFIPGVGKEPRLVIP